MKTASDIPGRFQKNIPIIFGILHGYFKIISNHITIDIQYTYSGKIYNIL